MFYSQVILAKKGPLAKVWLAAHWGDKKLARPQIFATDIAQSVDNIVNPVAPLALRMSGHLLLGVVRIYSRKVKYVLHDCTEAMLKLQMAFHPSSSTGGEHDKELLNLDHRQQQQGAPTTNIPNFGDYDQVHVVEGFCLPLPEPEDWIVADDTHAHAQATGGSGDGEQYSTTGTTNSQAPFHAAGGRSSISSPETTFQPPPEEAWVPFDPDHEDDDDDDNDNNENPALNQSRVSDVEVARAAGDSFLSNEEPRRSSILNKSMDTNSSLVGDRPANVEEEEDFAAVPFDSEDEGMGATMPTPNKEDSLLRLSEGGAAASAANASLEGIDGLEDSPTTGKRAASPAAARRRKRKRRKVIVDNDETELSNEDIREMLQDTSDLIYVQVHPAHYDPDDDQDEDDDDQDPTMAHPTDEGPANYYETLAGTVAPKPVAVSKQQRGRRKNATNQPVSSLTQAFLADDGYLHPQLASLWKEAFYQALDQPCPYERSPQADDVEGVRGTNEDDDDEEEDPSTAPGLQDEAEFGVTMEEEEEEEDDLPPQPLESEDEEEPPVTAFDSDGEEVALHQAQDVNDDDDILGDLGMTHNPLESSGEEDNDDELAEDRVAVGEHKGGAWHKHTIKVLQVLQQRLRPEDDNDNEKATVLEFADLAKNVHRRTAASCFIECLQLKTWDFLELEQSEDYGPIRISAGPRFLEAPPSHK